MSSAKLFVTSLVAFLITLGLLFAPMGLDWASRQQKAQLAQSQLAALRLNLYTPSGVTIVEETTHFLAPNYFNTCFGAQTTIRYGAQRSSEEILEDYRHGLLNTGWEIDPGYRAGNHYRKGNEHKLTIEVAEISADPTRQSFSVLYSIRLVYVTPSYDNCMG